MQSRLFNAFLNRCKHLVRQPKWLLHYYLVAAISLVTIVIAVTYSHWVMAGFNNALHTNRTWGHRLAQYSELEKLAGQVNAPGNDVFNSYNPDMERLNLHTHKARFLARLNTLRKEAKSIDIPFFLNNFDPIQDALLEMCTEAELIFSDLKNHNTQQAGMRMATMDYKYAILLNNIRGLETHVRSIQEQEFEKQQNTSQTLQWIEYGLALLGVLFLLGIAYHGQSLAGNFLTTVQQKEELLGKLNQQSEQLKTYVKEIEDIRQSIDEAAIVAITDVRGDLTYVNDQFCKISGYSREELIGQNHRILNSGTHPQEFFKEMWRTISNGNIWKGEIKNRTKDGNYYWVDSTIVPFLNEKGVPERYIAIRHDITARKVFESELVSAQKDAEQANRAKSEFLANMSHEIRTPMNGIMGMCQLLLETKLNAEQLEYTKTIDHSAESLLIIINDILDFSKIEAGKLSLENIPFHFAQSIEEMVELLLPKAQEKDFEFLVRIDPAIPKYLFADPGRIRQILLNLLTNAFKFTTHGHVIADIQCKQREGDDITLYCEVRDTGKGIAEENLPILFNKFTQEDSSTTRLYGGTGLGLAISKKLCEMMGGEIGVNSRLGHGSTFWFSINVKAHQVVEAPVVSEVDLSRLNILVVDDHEICRHLVSEYLSNWNIPHKEAANAQEAYSLLEQENKAGKPFDLAIVDYYMPEMDGLELGCTIKTNPTHANTKLIMLTSSGNRGDAKHFKEAGFSGYLIKPVSQSSLFDMIQSVSSGTQDTEFLTKYSLKETRREVQEARDAAALNSSDSPTIRVLLAEDNIINQKVATRMLEKLNVTIDVVANGKEAVQLSGMIPYDLILMDCQMPEMDGFEATAKIRERENGQTHIPIVALTANAMNGDDELCRQAGMDDYLSKPVSSNQLKAIFKKWVLDKQQTAV